LHSLKHALSLAGFTTVRVRHFSLRDNAQAFASSLFPQLDPMARKVCKLRHQAESLSFPSLALTASESVLRDILLEILYFGLVACSLPFAILESFLKRGSTLMIEARLHP
jgi:hypothetical protein